MGDENVTFFLNRSFVFPESGLERIKGKLLTKILQKNFPKEKFYLLDKDGQLIFDENGNPKMQESFFKKTIEKDSTIYSIWTRSSVKSF